MKKQALVVLGDGINEKFTFIGPFEEEEVALSYIYNMGSVSAGYRHWTTVEITPPEYIPQKKKIVYGPAGSYTSPEVIRGCKNCGDKNPYASCEILDDEKHEPTKDK